MPSPRAVADLVIVEPLFIKKKGDIFLPPGVQVENAVEFGRVVAVGPDYPWDVKVGDFVAFRAGEGTPIESEGTKYRAVAYKWLEAIVKVQDLTLGKFR